MRFSWPFDDMDSALARSREIDAPIFLYWGTKWCPPCAEMQTTVLQ
jgi:protein disulfide-isomerase